MRRRAAAIAMAAVATAMLSACGSTQRPEGIVERWLLALNQGKAGQLELYAPNDLSNRILPGWRAKDPGQLDVIEVGSSATVLVPGLHPCDPETLVPYRVVTLDGRTEMGTANLCPTTGGSDGEAWMVDGLLPAIHGLRVPSEGGPALGSAVAPMFLGAIVVAIVLSLLSMGLMVLVGKKPDPLPTYPSGTHPAG